MAKENKNQLNVKNIFDLFLIIKINYKFFFLFFIISFFSLYYFTSTKKFKHENVIINIQINNPYSQTDSFFYDVLELIVPTNYNNKKDAYNSPIKLYYDFFSEVATKNFSKNFSLNDFTITNNEPNDSSYLKVKYNKKITSQKEYEKYIFFVSNNLIRELNLLAFNVSYGILVNNLKITNTKISTINLISEDYINNNSFFLSELLNLKQQLEILNKIDNNFLILKNNKNYPQFYRLDIKYINNYYSFSFIIFSSVSIAILLTFLLFYFIEAFKNQRN